MAIGGSSTALEDDDVRNPAEGLAAANLAELEVLKRNQNRNRWSPSAGSDNKACIGRAAAHQYSFDRTAIKS